MQVKCFQIFITKQYSTTNIHRKCKNCLHKIYDLVISIYVSSHNKLRMMNHEKTKISSMGVYIVESYMHERKLCN